MRSLLPLPALLALLATAALAQDELALRPSALPETLAEGEPLVLELSGPGRQGLEFERLAYTVEGNRIRVRALATPAQTPARPFRSTLRVPNAEFDGQSWLRIEATLAGGEPLEHRIQIRGTLPPAGNIYRGHVLSVWPDEILRRPSAQPGDPRVILDRRSVDLPRNYNGYIKFRGEYLVPKSGLKGGSVRVRVVEVLVPKRGLHEGVVSKNRWGDPYLTLDDGRTFVLAGQVRYSKGQRVRVQAWLTPVPERASRWIRKDKPTAWVERVEATLTRAVQPKLAPSELAAGTRVWVTKTRFFGRFSHLEDDAGNALGYVRSKALSTDPSALSAPVPAPTPGLVGGLGGQ